MPRTTPISDDDKLMASVMRDRLRRAKRTVEAAKGWLAKTDEILRAAGRQRAEADEALREAERNLDAVTRDQEIRRRNDRY